MNKTTAMVVVTTAGLWLASCAEPATEDEINQMCSHLGDISGNSVAAAELARVTADYDARTRKLEDENAAAEKALGAEEDAKNAETKTQDTEARAAILAEYQKRKSDKANEFGVKMQKLNEERDSAVGKAKELADAEEATRNEIVNKCLADNAGGGVSKQIAQCRLGAVTADEYANKCE
jgi:hypothetical protein